MTRVIVLHVDFSVSLVTISLLGKVIPTFTCTRIQCFVYSMNVDDHKRGERVYFHAQGISSKNEVTDKDWQLLTFNSLRDKLEHTKVHADIETKGEDGPWLDFEWEADVTGCKCITIHFAFTLFLFSPANILLVLFTARVPLRIRECSYY